MKLPAELKVEHLTVLIDTSEPDDPHPWPLAPFVRFERISLETGDFGVKGIENDVTVERKTLLDFLACCGRERERFEKTVDRMRGFATKAIIIESDWKTIEDGNWPLDRNGNKRSKVTPASAMGSILSWNAKGIPTLLCETPERCGIITARILYMAARREWRRLRELAREVPDA